MPAQSTTPPRIMAADLSYPLEHRKTELLGTNRYRRRPYSSVRPSSIWTPTRFHALMCL